MKITRSTRPSARIEGNEGECRRSKAYGQRRTIKGVKEEVSRPSSRRRLTSNKPITAKEPTIANPVMIGKSRCTALLAKLMPMIGKSGKTSQRKMMDDGIAKKSAMPLARASLRSAGPILCTMG